MTHMMINVFCRNDIYIYIDVYIMYILHSRMIIYHTHMYVYRLRTHFTSISIHLLPPQYAVETDSDFSKRTHTTYM